MEIEKKPLITNPILKYLYVGLSVGGTLTLACNVYQDMQVIAQDKQHDDPESEATAAFLAAAAFGCCISKLLYNFWFTPITRQAAKIPIKKQSNTFKKKSKKTLQQKILQRTVQIASRKKDKSFKRSN